jgi:heme/copper-type cytochrome/quinol oxidase subunit 2
MPLMDTRRAAALVAFAGALAFALLASTRSGSVVAGESLTAAGQDPTVRSWSVTASRYKFSPSRLEVSQNDLVKIELRSEDIAHSMTIDAYRIAKRVSPGHPITFEFRADQPGTFPFYCNLQIEDGCRQMHGELVVKPRR